MANVARASSRGASGSWLLTASCCALILAATILAYWSVPENAYVSFDDDIYITDNPFVSTGLSWENLKWAIGLGQSVSYWQPVTMISLMLEVELLGVDPVHTHVINVMLHGINSILVLLLVARFFGSLRAGLVSGLIHAVHPLHVESVAWAVQRKTLLAFLFGLLVVFAYRRFLRRRRARVYGLLLALLMLSLMAKPAFMTLPVLLLVLDIEPLRRLRPKGERAGRASDPGVSKGVVLLEKLPLLVLGLAVALAGLLFFEGPERQVTPGSIPLSMRVLNAPVAIAWYVKQFVAPTGLCAFHPFPNSIETSSAVLGSFVLVALTVAVVLLRKRGRWLAAGWAWFLIALSPHLGLIRFGLWPAYAERFAYLPFVGLSLMVGLSVDAAAKTRSRFRAIPIALFAIWISVLIPITRAQVSQWKDSRTLYRQAVSRYPSSFVMLYKLGTAAGIAGDLAEAEAALTRAVEVLPTSSIAANQLGNVLWLSGRQKQAVARYESAVSNDPSNYEAVFNLATLLDTPGSRHRAATLFRKFAQNAPAEYQQQKVRAAMRAEEIDGRPPPRASVTPSTTRGNGQDGKQQAPRR